VKNKSHILKKRTYNPSSPSLIFKKFHVAYFNGNNRKDPLKPIGGS